MIRGILANISTELIGPTNSGIGNLRTTVTGALGHHNIIIINSIKWLDEAANGHDCVQPTIFKSNEDY